MHEPAREHIEAYLAGSDGVPASFTAHLNACAACEQEARELKLQAKLLRHLRYEAEYDPGPGFYARVIDRIDTQRRPSVWSLFREPAFGRPLAVASLALALLMGFFLFTSEPGHPGAATAQQTITLPGEDQVAPVFGVTPEQDRAVIFVDLATYRQ